MLLVCTAGVIEIFKALHVNGAADAHADDVLQPLALEPVRQLEDGDQRRAGRARDRHHVAGMIGVAVRQADHVRLVDLRPGGRLRVPVSHGSKTIRLPPGVVSTNVECPNQVIASAAMPR